MRYWIVCLICFTGFFFGCKTKKPTVFKEVQIGDRFTIQVPDFMNSTDQPGPLRMAMQYANDSAREYLVVFDTSRDGIHENTLKMYYDSMVSQFAVDSAVNSLPQFFKIKNDSVYKCEITGKMGMTKVFSEFETIATPDRYYTVITWGRLDQREFLKEDMDKILSSFTLLNRKKI